MNVPVAEQLDRSMQCEGVLECFFGVTELDRTVYELLTAEGHPFTVEQVAEAVDRERSTAYRSLRRLVDAGVVRRRQINYDDGGYYHVFEPVDADEVVDSLQHDLNDWYGRIDGLIGEFERRHGTNSARTADD
ncbi:helix-turn-helix domain-containing protein [Halobaculum rubrum]|uniref:helix-turn-helix domain-containing protein n=1 Tax=Halobaculum rubrum TaxID=2872158 RepID=UPI001CA43092|nr:helix-turn-helix domain-containing protein [Halobaculum rubrum]QZX99158.1 helix-turn-helix domain-containing protein [Halobaculum rubrum]